MAYLGLELIRGPLRHSSIQSINHLGIEGSEAIGTSRALGFIASLGFKTFF